MYDAGDTAAYDAVCEATNPEVECTQCGENHTAAHCPDNDVCGECLRDDAEMAEPKLCVDCAKEIERAAARDRRAEDWNAHGDWLRDQQKDVA